MHAELLSNSQVSWRCTSRSDTPRRAPKLLKGAKSAACTLKATSSCAFSAVDWWTHQLSPTQATLTLTVGDFLFHVLSFLSSSCSSSHCCFAFSCRVTPTDELQSFHGMYSLGLVHTFL